MYETDANKNYSQKLELVLFSAESNVVGLALGQFVRLREDTFDRFENEWSLGN